MRDFLSEVKKYIVKETEPITGWKKREAIYHGPEEYQYLDKEWSSLEVGDDWSEGEHTTTFFKAQGGFPAEWAGQQVNLKVETGGEACLYINGQIYHGLDENHHHAPLESEKWAGDKLEIMVEGALNRINKIYVPAPNYRHQLSVAEFQLINSHAEEFYFNILALVELYEALKEREEAGAYDIKKLIKELKTVFFNEVDFIKLNQLYQQRVKDLNQGNSYQMACFGHAHIDVAWLWQFKETVRKTGRTFSTALRLMEKYPEFQFIQSQPQLYQYVKRFYPTLYQEIKEKVDSGQWQPEGAMWVEADTNLPSGESLVRQFLYGKQFFKEEFGIDSRVCWLPDVFGYTGALPQIMKKSEVDYFMTSKISWNDTNEFPYAIFHWEGIDGSSVLTHIPRVILPFTYNGEVYADKVLKVKDNYQEQKKENLFEYKFGDSSNYFKQQRVIPDDQLIYIYGYGDGGGGVTEEFIEKIKRFDQLPYLPQMKYSQPKEYFEKLDEDMIQKGVEYPTWRGELYFEYHRGTYTSQAETKLNNRLSEVQIRNAEILNTLTGVSSQEKIKEIWQDIAINQFHDIIPGTSITEVYQDVDQIYAQIKERIDDIIEQGIKELAREVKLPHSDDSAEYYLIWNGLGYARDLSVNLDYKETWNNKKPQIYDLAGEGEIEWIYRQKQLEFQINQVPALGYKVVRVELGDYEIEEEYTTTNSKVVENDFFKLTFDQGNLSSIYDKRREMELVAKDKLANQLQFFVDQPPRYQAWEQVAEFEEERISDKEIKLIDFEVRDYQLKQVVHLTHQFRDSIFEQEIILYNNIDRIDFVNDVDWKEREVMVKVAFPVDINSDQARYEIAYGNLVRSTTNNTDYEKAQFEVPGQRWVDLSQPGLGASLITDCKYGYDVKDNQIRLTLLKGPNYPDKTCDYGQHQFTYSFYAHNGIFYQSDLLEHAESLTNPPICRDIRPGSGDEKIIACRAQVARGNSRLEVLKESEDGEGQIIRLYEPYGAREKVEVLLDDSFNVETAQIVNLLENSIEGEVKLEDNRLTFMMEPFEIKTIKLS